MRRWLLLESYHWLVLLMVMALVGGLVTWISVGLIDLAMANIDFIRRFGLRALAEGGLIQALEIGGKVLLVFLGFLLFKGIETELICRWRGGSEE
jgi:hypothetical protein